LDQPLSLVGHLHARQSWATFIGNWVGVHIHLKGAPHTPFNQKRTPCNEKLRQTEYFVYQISISSSIVTMNAKSWEAKE
jgi:hypothetical protein